MDLSEQAAGEDGSGGSTGGGGNGGRGGVGGATGGAGGGPAGTGGVDFCDPNPCQNGGICGSTPNGWVCRCPAGTFGADCSGNVDDCNPNRCENGGICEDEIGGFRCVCEPGFTGDRCEDVDDDCDPNPCLNGGTCLITADGTDCDCPEGWRGRRCEIRREPCNPNPCLNGGFCIDQMIDFLCACQAGFTGDRCETPISGECPSPNPCLNGGTCNPSGGGAFTCECIDGFSPPFCQCLGMDEPDGDACRLTSVCGLPSPEAFGGGDPSSNTEELADWWCQLGGYAEAASYVELTSGSARSYYYEGMDAEVLSTCEQVIGPANYGFQTFCTGVTDLACRGIVDNSLRSLLMVCGNSDRNPVTFIPAGTKLTFVSGCTPNDATQALMITRTGLFATDAGQLRAYLHEGGIVVTEYSSSDEIWSSVFPPVNQPGQQLGSCQDNVPTVVQFSPMDPFWQDNEFEMISSSQSGCGYAVGHYPYITPLAGWDNLNVALGYRNLGQGRVYAADFDWQDQEPAQPALLTLLGYMITHRR